MRVLVVGASGAIGTHLVPQLRARGHEVIGTSRSAGKAERLCALGAEPVVLDVLDAEATRQAVAATQPDAIIYQATALAELSDFKHFDRSFAQTNRLRTEGTDILLAAARDAGVRRFVAQSYANFRYAREGGPVKTEDDPLDPTPPAAMRQTVAAMSHLDRAVTHAGGIALRYGNFYGDPNDGLVTAVRARKFPIVGDGQGVWSHIHLDDAAAATVLALEHEGPAIYNIVDDEPATTRVWLPELANIVGAEPPQRFPRLLARLLAGEAPVLMATQARGTSNARARRELGWTLRYPGWRQGFVAAYGEPQAVTAGGDQPTGQLRDSWLMSPGKAKTASAWLTCGSPRNPFSASARRSSRSCRSSPSRVSPRFIQRRRSSRRNTCELARVPTHSQVGRVRSAQPLAHAGPLAMTLVSSVRDGEP